MLNLPLKIYQKKKKKIPSYNELNYETVKIAKVILFAFVSLKRNVWYDSTRVYMIGCLKSWVLTAPMGIYLCFAKDLSDSFFQTLFEFFEIPC